jgi:hypothetical protein
LMHKREALNKKNLLRGTTTSFDNAGCQTDAEWFPQEALSGRSIYYNRPAHQRMIPVSFGSPLVHHRQNPTVTTYNLFVYAVCSS